MGLPINFLQHRKMQQNTSYWKNLGNWSYTFPIVWCFFPVRFIFYGILHHMGNPWVFSSDSHSLNKYSKTHRKPATSVCILFPQYGCFSLLYSHPVVYFITWEWHASPHQFPIAQENAVKSTGLREASKLVPTLSTKYRQFYSIRFPSYGILYHMVNAQLFPSISHSMGKCRKAHPVSFQVVFPQHYFFRFFQNLVIP